MSRAMVYVAMIGIAMGKKSEVIEKSKALVLKEYAKDRKYIEDMIEGFEPEERVRISQILKSQP